MEYESWGVSELIEKLENSDTFASEITKYFSEKKTLTKTDIYLQERARKLSGDKIKQYENNNL